MVSWFALALSLAGIFLNAKKLTLCWPVWILSNILWIIHVSTQPQIDWPNLILWIVFAGSNVYGWYEWNHPHIPGLEKYKIRKMTEEDLEKMKQQAETFTRRN